MVNDKFNHYISLEVELIDAYALEKCKHEDITYGEACLLWIELSAVEYQKQYENLYGSYLE